MSALGIGKGCRSSPVGGQDLIHLSQLIFANTHPADSGSFENLQLVGGLQNPQTESRMGTISNFEDVF